MPSVHISVVVTATPGRNDHFIEAFLASLFATSADAPFGLAVTLTDNSPGTGIGRRLQARYPGIRLIENAERRGYAANHNTALQGASADYLVVANDDLEFLPGGLQRAIAELERPDQARVGAAGLNLRNPDGSLQPSTYSFPTVTRILLDQSGLRALIPFGRATAWLARLTGRGDGRSRFWAHDRSLDVDTFRGALVIVRAACVAEVGWMDESTLLGGEETDWHRRMWDAGWRVRFIHDAHVVHHGSQTVRVSPGLAGEFLKGAINYIGRYRGRVTYGVFRAALVAVRAVRWLGAAARGPESRRQAARMLAIAWSWEVPPVA